MTSLKIRVQSLEDAIAGKPVIEGLIPEQVKESSDCTIAILENGTEGHQDVLMIFIKNEDGTYAMTQITENLFNGLISAFKGAQLRFADEKGGKKN